MIIKIDPDRLAAITVAKRPYMRLSFAQLMIGLVKEGWLTEADAQLWLTGVLPPQVQATISLLPEENRFPAMARASRPSEVLRTDPLVEMMALAQGRTAEELDAFFETYSAV